MDQLLKLSYYLAPIPEGDFRYTKITLAFALLLILGGVAFHIWRKKGLDEVWKKVLKKVPGQLYTYGLILLILLFSRETGIPYLSMRLWWVLWAAFFLYALLKWAINGPKNYSKWAETAKKRLTTKNYLPRKKKK